MNVGNALAAVFCLGFIIIALGTLTGKMLIVYLGAIVLYHAVYGGIVLWMA